MPTKEIRIPKFKNEAAEAAWWDAHPSVATRLMARALKAGTARRSPLKTVTIRLLVADVETARDLAQKKGLPYQTYMKALLHEALEKERRGAG